MDFKLYKPGFILFAISVIAGLLLAVVFQVTKEPIAIAAEAAAQEAMAAVLPAATEFKDTTANYTLSGTVYSVNEGLDASGAVVGYIVGVAPSGYGGPVKTLVSFNLEGVIQDIEVVEMAETPGLGALATESWFSDQYMNKTAPLEVVKGITPETAGETEISAITGSTITTKAVTDGVNEASDFYNANLKGGN